MSSTWIQMPIENAKEVAQRYIKNALSLPDTFNLSYNSDCEVYFTTRDLSNWSFDPSYFYVGYIYCGGTISYEEASLSIWIEDNSNNTVTMLDGSSFPILTTNYPVIFNNLNAPSREAIFIGYKFNATY